VASVASVYGMSNEIRKVHGSSPLWNLPFRAQSRKGQTKQEVQAHFYGAECLAKEAKKMLLRVGVGSHQWPIMVFRLECESFPIYRCPMVMGGQINRLSSTDRHRLITDF
jgi:hypothetical protein